MPISRTGPSTCQKIEIEQPQQHGGDHAELMVLWIPDPVGFQNVAIVADQRFQAAVPWDREGPHLAAAGRNMWIAEAAR